MADTEIMPRTTTEDCSENSPITKAANGYFLKQFFYT